MNTNHQYRKRERIAIVMLLTIVAIGFILPKYIFPEKKIETKFSKTQIDILDSLMVDLNTRKESEKEQKHYPKKSWKNSYSGDQPKKYDSNKYSTYKKPSKASENFNKNFDKTKNKSQTVYEEKSYEEGLLMNSTMDSTSDSTSDVVQKQNIYENEKSGYTQYEVQLKDDRIIDINSADAEELQYLRGIGKVLSERIIKYRDNLGGFHTLDQVAETYGLPPETFEAIQHQLQITSTIKKININEVDEKTLAKHLLFSYKQAKWLIAFRDQHGAYESAEDLLSLRMVDTTLMNIWAPYLAFDQVKNEEVTMK